MPHVHAACPCHMSMLHDHASCPSFTSMLHVKLHVHATCPGFMSMLHVHASCPCYMSMLDDAACQCWMLPQVHADDAACPCCMSMTHGYMLKWTFCMDMLHIHAEVHAACLSCVSILHVQE
jgi:hypothetical protein